MGGTCYGTSLVTDEKALYTGSTWGQAVGAGVRVGYRIARSGRPKKRPMLRIIELRMFCDWKSRMHNKTNDSSAWVLSLGLILGPGPQNRQGPWCWW